MIRSIENFHLGLLRLVLLLSATVVLIATLAGAGMAVFLGTRAAVVAPYTEATGQDAEAGATGTVSDKQPNSWLERVAAMIRQAVGTPDAQVDAAKLQDYLAQRMQALPDGQRDAYADQLADWLGPALGQPGIKERLRTAGAFEARWAIVESLLNEFDHALATADMERDAAKAKAKVILYGSMAGFAAFLMLAFLLILIRIERNLRPLSAALTGTQAPG